MKTSILICFHLIGFMIRIITSRTQQIANLALQVLNPHLWRTFIDISCEILPRKTAFGPTAQKILYLESSAIDNLKDLKNLNNFHMYKIFLSSKLTVQWPKYCRKNIPKITLVGKSEKRGYFTEKFTVTSNILLMTWD
jgi:hypothetical protein